MKKDSFVKGTMIAYIATIIVKLLGVLYIIPFYSIIGEEGGVLYSYAYNIYNLFLNISTSGIPIAISIIISEYVALKKFKIKEQIFTTANKLMFIISFITFLVMFIFAPQIALFLVKDIVDGSSISDVVLVLRSVSFCLLITPFLSIIRGYLQGHKYVSPTSASQIIEQVVRIFIILVGSYIAINILNTSISVGVAVALFGAFIGGVVAYIYLKLKIKRSKKDLFGTDNTDKDNTLEEEKMSTKSIIKMVLCYSFPIILVSVTNNIYNIVDMRLILKALTMIGFEGHTTELIASVVCTWTPKICMVIGAAAIGMSASIIPHIASSFVVKDMKEVNNKYTNAINMVLFLTIPLATGVIIFSEPIYYIFYGINTYGPSILIAVAIINVVSSIFVISSTILQSMKRYSLVIFGTIAGLLLNVALDIPMVLLLNKLNFYPYLGTVFATIISYCLSNIIVFLWLKKDYNFKYNNIIKFLKKLFIPLVTMIVVAITLNYIYPIKIGGMRYLSVLSLLLVYALISGGTFIFLIYKNKGLEMIFDSKSIDKVLIKSHLKKKNEN